MLQLCSTMLALIKVLTRIANGIANFGHISRDDDYNRIAPQDEGDAQLMAKPFWQECGAARSAEDGVPADAKSYSLNQLVLKLTDDESYDRKFQQTFITTYQSFCVPQQLLDKLMQRYRVPPTLAQFDDKRRKAIQLRVAVVLKYWCDKYFFHFDDNLVHSLGNFLRDGLMHDGHVDMAKALNAFIHKKLAERAEEQEVAFRVPQVIYPQRHKENPQATVSPLALWYQIDVTKLAQIITMIDFELYAEVSCVGRCAASVARRVSHVAVAPSCSIRHGTTASSSGARPICFRWRRARPRSRTGLRRAFWRRAKSSSACTCSTSLCSSATRCGSSTIFSRSWRRWPASISRPFTA